MPKLTFTYEHDSKFPRVNKEFNAHSTTTDERCKLGNWISESYLERIIGTVPRNNDIILATYARSGTTLTRQLINALLDQAEGLPVTEAIDNPNYAIFDRACFIELDHPRTGQLEVDNLAKMTGPRRQIIKTHLPAFIAPESVFQENNQAKIVLVTRNPLDCSVSNYKFSCNDPDIGSDWENNQVSFNTWAHMWISETGELNGGSWIDWHNGWLKNLQKYPQNYNNNVKIVYYEDILNNFEATVLDLARFLSINNDIDVEKVRATIDEYRKVTRVEAMQNALNKHMWIKDFVRKGQVGDSVNFYSRQMADELRAACEKRLNSEFFQTIRWPNFENFQ